MVGIGDIHGVAAGENTGPQFPGHGMVRLSHLLIHDRMSMGLLALIGRGKAGIIHAIRPGLVQKNPGLRRVPADVITV